MYSMCGHPKVVRLPLSLDQDDAWCERPDLGRLVCTCTYRIEVRDLEAITQLGIVPFSVFNQVRPSSTGRSENPSVSRDSSRVRLRYLIRSSI